MEEGSCTTTTTISTRVNGSMVFVQVPAPTTRTTDPDTKDNGRTMNAKGLEHTLTKMGTNMRETSMSQ